MSKSKEKTISEKLIEFIDDLILFVDSKGIEWARAEGQCFPIESNHFEDWLRYKYYNQYQKAPYKQAVQKAIDLASSRAKFDPNSYTEDVNIRVAKVDEAIIVDRVSKYGTNTVEISAAGWQNGATQVAKFWRPKGMNELPKPESGGTIYTLRKYLNIRSDSDFRLLIAWLLTAYNPEIPCPILVLQGEQGSAKSTTAKVLRSLVDPNGALIRSAPKNEEDLIVQAQHSHIICLDNLSGLKDWLSDALCRVCTGSGFSTRTKFTNRDEEIFRVKRPIILNGIDEIATRGDLLDRSIVLNLPPIPSNMRKDSRSFWREFERDKPFILGALFNAVSEGLRVEKPSLKSVPRMADFAEWATRCETAFNWENGTVIDDYKTNEIEAVKVDLDSNYLACAIQKIMSHKDKYEGTATEILEEVRNVSPEINDKHFPKLNQLKSELTRLAPAFRKIGIEYDDDRTAQRRLHIFERISDKASLASQNGRNHDAYDASNSKLYKTEVDPNGKLFGPPALSENEHSSNGQASH